MSFAPAESPPLIVRLAPLLFVLLWSTGFIGAKLGLPYASPMVFLLLRFAIVAALLLCVIAVLAEGWPGWRAIRGQAITGVLMHGFYLGGVFWAIDAGMNAGLAALIVGLQPALTALLTGPVLGERIGRWAPVGFALGIVGVTLVVFDGARWRLDAIFAGGVDPLAYLSCGLALGCMTAALLWQKRVSGAAPPWTAQAAQSIAALVVFLLAATVEGEWRVVWTVEFAFALGWLVLVLSIGAIGLLLLLIRHGAAAQTASLFFLTPPVTAVIAWAVFDEQLGWGGLAGMAIAVLGVWLARRPAATG